ncbi:MAG: GAF domain-containing sensor histidine kinase [Tepidiformaceae bacterium]
MKLQTIKLLTVFAPVVFLGITVYIALFHLTNFLQTVPGFIALSAGIALATFAFSTVAFRAIDRLEARVIEQNRQLVVLAKLASVTAESLDLTRVLNLALDQVLEVTGSEAGVICLLDAEAEELVAACHRGISDDLVAQIQRQKLGVEPIGTEAVLTGKPVLVEETFAGPATREMFEREGFHTALSVPLKADNEVSGVLGIASRRQTTYSAAQIELLVNISAQLGLAVRNSLLLAKTSQRNHELAALLAVGRAASSSLDLAALLDEALDAIVSVTSADGAEVWLNSRDGGLNLARQRGIEFPAGEAVDHLGPGEGLPGLVVTSGTALVIDDIERQPAGVRDAVCRAGFRSYSAFPIRTRGEMLGVLGVASKDVGSLSGAGYSRLLGGIGEQLAVAVENVQLHDRVLDVAIVEERERIARELHDGLAQVLGYINTQTMAVRKLLGMGRVDDADRQLQSMEDAARSAYADVREAILGLSTSLPSPGDLVAAVRAYVEHFSRMVPFRIEVALRSDFVTAGIPAAAEIQIMRILQEALSNIRKHANATRVDVIFTEAGGTLRIDIDDDGTGFDVSRSSRAGWPQFGIQSMKERAKAIGGTLVLESHPGTGTHLTLAFPSSTVHSEAVVARSVG